MFASQNQLRSDFEAELLRSFAYPPERGARIFRLDERNRYHNLTIEQRWLGYMMGCAHIASQRESLQDHIETNIELRARVRELEDRLHKEGIDP